MTSETSRETIESIKKSAIRHLEGLDPKAVLRTTDYFNHSFAPDLVMRWPNSGSVDRFVYLRVSDRANEFRDDVQNVSDQHPMILGMNGLHSDESEVASLTAEAQELDTFVGDIAAIDQIGEARKSSPYAALIGTAVAQGGRGVLLGSRTQQVTSSIAGGFEGAKSLDAGVVAAASATASDLLSAPFAARLNRLLQAVWIGAGGQSVEFPAGLSLSNRLDIDALAFLLDLPDLNDFEFWNRIGRTLELSLLAQLSEPERSPNFHHLIASNLDVLKARACHLVDTGPSLFDQPESDEWKWIVSNGALALQSATLTAYVAEKADDLDAHPGTKTDGVSVERFRKRSVGSILTSVSISDGRDNAGLQNLQGEDVAQSEKLTALAAAWGSGARIKRASALVASGASMHLDFTESAASSVTRSTFTLPELLGGAIPLLRDLDDSAKGALADFLEVQPSEGDQISFFDD